jgi:hypothetical protein
MMFEKQVEKWFGHIFMSCIGGWRRLHSLLISLTPPPKKRENGYFNPQYMEVPTVITIITRNPIQTNKPTNTHTNKQTKKKRIYNSI